MKDEVQNKKETHSVMEIVFFCARGVILCFLKKREWILRDSDIYDDDDG